MFHVHAKHMTSYLRGWDVLGEVWHGAVAVIVSITIPFLRRFGDVFYVFIPKVAQGGKLLTK